ncbi:hypothetical protein HPP92_023355 [Vanilla planifolia]|uniref:Uncharacterized protein n=1 Tax=Vanilla planifolia TaxID=51239 RepID=A0A835UEE0_VANPL|nr:hypothetical protein HPP92_023355 [Vanilla planifolia]
MEYAGNNFYSSLRVSSRLTKPIVVAVWTGACLKSRWANKLMWGSEAEWLSENERKALIGRTRAFFFHFSRGFG